MFSHYNPEVPSFRDAMEDGLTDYSRVYEESLVHLAIDCGKTGC